MCEGLICSNFLIKYICSLAWQNPAACHLWQGIDSCWHGNDAHAFAWRKDWICPVSTVSFYLPWYKLKVRLLCFAIPYHDLCTLSIGWPIVCHHPFIYLFVQQPPFIALKFLMHLDFLVLLITFKFVLKRASNCKLCTTSIIWLYHTQSTMNMMIELAICWTCQTSILFLENPEFNSSKFTFFSRNAEWCPVNQNLRCFYYFAASNSLKWWKA